METEPPKNRAATTGFGQLLVDLGPVALFMVAYNLAHSRAPDSAVFVATGVFMAATTAALLYARIVQKRLPAMLLVTTIIVLIFGGLTLALHNALFIKIKPTIINLLYAGAIFGGLMFRTNIWKLLFQNALTLPDHVWDVLAVRWGLFFVFLAALNEFIWRTCSEAFWANFKFFGVMPITLLFVALNFPLMMKHLPKDEADSADG